MKAYSRGTRCAAICALSFSFVAAGFAERAKPQAANGFKRAASEVAVEGLTIAEHRAAQRELHAMLAQEMPLGAMDRAITVRLTQQERDDLQRVQPIAGQPLRIGTVMDLPTPLTVTGIAPSKRGNVRRVAGGTLDRMADGGFSWAVAVESEGARAIRVHLTNFSLPRNTEMYIFNAAGEAYGPYTGQGRQGTGEFWTDSVRSSSGVILIRQLGRATPAELANISFTIDQVGHIGDGTPVGAPRNDSWNDGDMCGWNGNPPCVEDANCGSVTPADQSAIAKMEWISGCCIYTCTGGLIADTDGSSQRNLFLTANHCLSRQRLADRVETFFEYTTSSCNGDCPHDPPPHTSGSTLLATSKDGDFTLLELDQDPPAGSTFLGWDSTPIANNSGASLTRVSNPNYGPQVLSKHSVDTGTGTCSGLPRGEFIYSHDDFGATDGGSSGSPVVNSAGEIVGQLFGACGFNVNDPCDFEANATVDGALAFYFSNVEEFLDPSGGCSSDAECDDGDPCNGAETCVGGSCQSGTEPPCQNGDGCCPSGCDSGNDDDCGGGCTLAQKNEPCDSGADCCSGICKRNGTCR